MWNPFITMDFNQNSLMLHAYHVLSLPIVTL